jgi:hypothetical protein
MVRQCALLGCILTAAGAAAARVPGSPYATASAGLNSTTLLYKVDETLISQDDVLTASTLQGVLSRRQPRMFRVLGDAPDYPLWLGLLQSIFGVAVNESYVNDTCGLVSLFAGELAGYVLADLADNSSSAAFTACAAAPLVAFTPNNVACAAGLGLQLVADVRGQPQAAVIAAFNNSGNFTYNAHIVALQDPALFDCIGDYSVFSGAVNFWDVNMTSALSNLVFGSLSPPAAAFGWGVSENGFVGAVTAVGGYVHGSNYAYNLDVLTNFDIPSFSQAGGGGGGGGGTSTHGPAVRTTQVHTVCFVLTDGDNVQWLLDGFATMPAWWGSPDRGKVNIGWTLAPAMADLAPVVMAYLYATASNGSGPAPGHDYFVSGVSGVGYAYPDLYADAAALEAFAGLTGGYVAKAGMRIVNVLGWNYDEAAAAAYLAQPAVDGLLWYNYRDYSQLAGNISFVGGKPVIGGRFSLWDGPFYNTTTLTAALLEMPKTPDAAEGYSLVPVHVWSNNVTDVVTVAEALAAAGGFQVVTPDVFVDLITANIAH